MGRFYGLKVLNGDMYLENVPRLWRLETEHWLEENGTA